jgi:ribosomal protein L40E
MGTLISIVFTAMTGMFIIGLMPRFDTEGFAGFLIFSLLPALIMLPQFLIAMKNKSTASENNSENTYTVRETEGITMQYPETVNQTSNSKVCSSCGAVMAGTAKFCDKCGQKYVEPVKPLDEAISPTDNEGSATFCYVCGKSIPGDSLFCPFCGEKFDASRIAASPTPPMTPPSAASPMTPTPAVAPAPPIAPTPAAYAGMSIPSLYALRCPSCGGGNLQALGEKGATSKSIGTALAFGAIGNIAVSSRAAKNLETSPMQYKCVSCGNKFVTAPLMAQPEEMLAAPCNVNFQRVSSFVGAAIAHIVYLNGVKAGPVKNGKTISFPTNIRYNTIFVTDPHGVAFKDMYRFEAQPGGSVDVRFNRKFL